MASLKDSQQKTVTASGKPAFHPPGCSPPGRCAHGSVTRPCPCCRLLPCLTLQGKHSRECRFYQKCRASVGWRHARPACFAVPAGYCQKRISPHSFQAHGRRPRVQILPRSQKGKALTMDVVRAFLYSPLFRPAAKPCALPQPSGSRPKHYRSFSTKRVRVSLAASFL